MTPERQECANTDHSPTAGSGSNREEAAVRSARDARQSAARGMGVMLEMGVMLDKTKIAA